jgi:hypothetical protein
MATQVQLRRGTATENNSFTGAQGELTYDTTNKRVRVHDGGTAGGFEIVTEDASGNINTGTVTADGLTVDGDVTLNDGSPNLRLQDTDTSRYIDMAYGTRAASFTNTMASGEDIDTVEPWINFSFKDDGETRTAMTIDHDGNVGIGTGSPSEQINLVGSGGTSKIRFDGNSSNLQNNFIGITGYDDLIIASDEANTGSDSTIQFRVDASEKMRITSDGLVGISNSTPSSFFAGARNLVVGSGSGNNGMTIYSGTSNTGNIKFADGTGSDAAKTAGGIRYDHSGGFMRFDTNDGSERLRITSGGAVGIGTSSPSRTLDVHSGSAAAPINIRTTQALSLITFDNSSDTSGNHLVGFQGDDFVVGDTNISLRLLSAGGICFGSDTAAANALDDYEEGTWTPTVSNSSGYAAQVGRYTKVGRLVTLQFQVQWTQSGTTFGILSGLPFTIDDVSRITIVGREYNSAGFLIQANTQVGTTQSYQLCKADGTSTAVNGQSYGWGAHFSYIT